MHTLPRYLHQKTKVWNFSVEEKVSAQLSTHSERAVCGLSADTTLIISFGISILTPCFWRQTCLNLKELFLAGHNRFQEDEMSIILSLQSFWQDNPIVFSPVTFYILQFTNCTAISESIVTTLAFYCMSVNPWAQCKIIISLIDFSIILLTTLSKSFVRTAFILIISIRWSEVLLFSQS